MNSHSLKHRIALIAGTAVAAALLSGCAGSAMTVKANSADAARLALSKGQTDKALSGAEAAVAASTSAARQAAAAAATAEAELKALQEKAGSAADDPVAARQAAAEASTALHEARQRAAQVEALQAQIAKQERAGQALEQQLQAAITALALQQQSAASARQRAAGLRAVIREALGEGVEPAAALRSLEPLSTALRTLAASAEAAARCRSQLEQASSRLATELADSPFRDGEAAAAALWDAARRQELAQRIQAYERELIELRGLLAAADLQDLPEQRPDTAAAQGAAQAADARRSQALGDATRVQAAQVELQRLAEEHHQALQLQLATRQQAQLLAGVAERCQGKAAPYISLQRWVLSAYLAEICQHANQRLTLMTSGRYQLRLSDEGGRGGRQAGLGLRVLDAYTGEEREVSSLSGGETFQASLALALGVAETVQAHAGGVHLDALFIDEGFGSLDPDNLQLAMDELERLRAGGRLIGVISHVAALRERIRARIEVSSGERGSTARVCGV